MIKIVKDILEIFDKNGLWDDGVELIGSWCFLLYQKHYGVKKYPLRTTDIDFLIPFPYKGKKNIDLVKQLEMLGYRYGFNADGSLYLKNAAIRLSFYHRKRDVDQKKPSRLKTYL